MMIERWFALLSAAFITSLLSVSVHAQEPLRVALFKTANERAELSQLAAALDPVLHAELDKVPKLRVVSQPALDLPGLQLALDCVGETPSCLAMATQRTEADALVAPTLTRTDSGLVLSLLLYDPREAAAMQVVTRRFENPVRDETVLKAVTGLVRELFGVTEQPSATKPAEPQPEPAPKEAVPPPTAASKPRGEPSIVVPLVLGAAGVAIIGAGIGLGVAANSGQDRYDAQRVRGNEDANRALDRLSSAQTTATWANVAFGVGGAALAAGIVVFVVQRAGRASDATPTGTRIVVGMGRVGVAGSWN